MNGSYLVYSLGINELTDLELVGKIREGDNYAFTEIVRRYKCKVAATINGMIGRCHEADDIGQEVFIRFYNAINSFRGDATLGTYLTRIAINLSLNEIKRKKVKRVISFEKILEEGFDISDVNKNDYNNTKEIIQLAMQKLNAKYRSVLVLRLIDEFSTDETAKILDLPIGTVLSRLSRAQQKLKKYLQPYMSEL
jgi:RNA polymerase sigma-70 factor, ECF subfamily